MYHEIEALVLKHSNDEQFKIEYSKLCEYERNFIFSKRRFKKQLRKLCYKSPFELIKSFLIEDSEGVESNEDICENEEQTRKNDDS